MRPLATENPPPPRPQGECNLLGYFTRGCAAGVMFAFVLAGLGRAADEADPLVTPAHRIAPDDPAWGELAGGLRKVPAVTASFTELRRFSFKKTPTVLKGDSRVSAERGLSLHYLEPEDQTVVIDGRGMLIRTPQGDRVPPDDPRAGAANGALLHVLRLDLPALAETFELYGARRGPAWTLALVPKDADLRRTLGQISVEGTGTEVQRIELRRSVTQRVEILVDPPRSTAAFTPDEIHRFFR
jgi:Outer membrane lipoprotein carrier protein LolA-like